MWLSCLFTLGFMLGTFGLLKEMTCYKDPQSIFFVSCSSVCSFWGYFHVFFLSFFFAEI